MKHGNQIYLHQLSQAEIAEDGRTATIGAGTLSETVLDTLWAPGKQTGEW